MAGGTTKVPGVVAQFGRVDATEGDRFLKAFGKPIRLLNSEAERAGDAALEQVFALLGDGLANRAIAKGDNCLGELLDSPLPSKSLRRYGEPGPGKWITVWAKNDHSFITICGLRLGTGWVRDGDERGPRWKKRSRPTPGYVQRHPRGF